MKQWKLSVAAALMLTAAGASQAAAVFSGGVNCSWGNAQAAVDTVYTITNADGGGVASMNWGVPGDGTTLDNQFTCNGLGSDGGGWTTELGQTFRIADFSYRNGSTFYGDLTSIDLMLALSVTNVSAYSGAFAYRMLTLNTPNVTGDPILDGDVVTIANNGLTAAQFDFGGTAYTLRLLGFSTDNGSTITTGFSSPEGANVSAGIYAQIQSVPEPSTGLLVAGAAGAMLLVRRRQNTKASASEGSARS